MLAWLVPHCSILSPGYKSLPWDGLRAQEVRSMRKTKYEVMFFIQSEIS